MEDIDKQWDALVLKLEKQFDDEMTLKGILYLIGVQELNMGLKRFGREEKLDIQIFNSGFIFNKFICIIKVDSLHFLLLKNPAN